MVRSYKKKLGGRTYKNYTEKNIEDALQRVVTDGWTLRRASREHRVPYGTLFNRYHGIHARKNGGQTIFSKIEEEALIKSAAKCGEWGFPLSLMDLRQLAKNFLDSQGRTIDKFVSNLPGNDWAYSLLKRNKSELTQKVATNIKRPRGNVSNDILIKYFQNIDIELKNIPACNIFNYDETNLQDDPGKKRMLFRRGTKYPEQICNFAKTSTSLMLCISASGVLLPPYVIYKAEKMWLQWTENGPKGFPCCNKRCCASGCRYNRTHHGWIDAQTFNEWFVSSFLPHAKGLPGRKILIGDNLSSHFCKEVLDLCEDNNISFICLPKNSTHLTQPLDVVFFRPFKEAWRATLRNWKNSHIKQTSIDKRDFPQLLNSTLRAMDGSNGGNAIMRHAITSFAATGLVPFNPDRVLKKLPKENEENVDNEVNDILVNYLKEKRYVAAPSRTNVKRSKLSIVAGKSVTAPKDDDSSSDSDVDFVLDKSNDDDAIAELEDETVEEIEYMNFNKEDIKMGKYLLVKVLGGRRKKESYRYVALIREIKNDEIEVSGLKSVNEQKSQFRIEENDDFTIEIENVIAILPDPTIESTSKGDFTTYCFNKRVDVKEL